MPARQPQLRFDGFHFHLMLHQRDVAMQLQLVQAYVETALRWRERYALPVHVVNAGGGFGIDYADHANSFDWQAFCDGLRALALPQRHDLRIRFEPGRYVSVGCGYYVVEVLDIKRSHGEHFAIARGGTHHFRTPPAQGHDHPFQVIRGHHAPDVMHERVTLVGQLCTQGRAGPRATGGGAGDRRLPGLSLGWCVCVEYFASELPDACAAGDGVS